MDSNHHFLNRFTILMCRRLPVGVTMQRLIQTTSFMVDVPGVILARFPLRVRSPRAHWVQCCGASATKWDNLKRVGAATARLRRRSRGEDDLSGLLGGDVQSRFAAYRLPPLARCHRMIRDGS